MALDSTRASLPDGSRRDLRMRAGRPQILMTDAGPTFVQSLQWNRAEGPSIVRVAVLAGDRVGIGMSTADAVADLAVRPRGARSTSGSEDAMPRDIAINRYYDTMRQAMRAGDWVRFGAAFDSLGRTLARRPR